MRSADLALGVPFNIASYALLTHIVAKLTGLLPGTLCIYMTDAHVYESHINNALQQSALVPKSFPQINLPQPDEIITSVDDNATICAKLNTYIMDATSVIGSVSGYNPHPSIKYTMVNTSIRA